MELKQITSGYKGFSFFLVFFLTLRFSPAMAQFERSNSVQKNTNAAVEQINKIGDEAKAKYAENIDNPYIPVKVNPDYTTPTVIKTLSTVLKKYVNYYFVSKVPAYKNLGTGLTIRKIDNGEVTEDYVRFTSGSDNHSKDTVTIYFKDIINDRIIYYVKVTDGGFYMPYVRIKDHLLTCGGKEFADLLFFMQQKQAVKYYSDDLENFKALAIKYHSSPDLPVMGDEQRKLFVQGNAMNKQLDYNEALKYYLKAFSLDPVSYPEGYYNYAVIAGLAENYELAILNMKKYLLLLPNAADAVTAQDKIYEWEALIVKNQQ